MIDIADFARRIRRRRILAGVLFFGGAGLMTVSLFTRLPVMVKGEFAAVWLFVMGIGGYFYFRSMELPVKEIMQLAEDKGGVLTLSEICTALGVDPDVALRALVHLQRVGVAAPRWQEIQKNLWEFPDAIKLPIGEAIDLAKEGGGRVTIRDLVAAGHSVEVAEQTFDAIAEKGLAQQETGSSGRCLRVGGG
jgi:hypothetical protein